AAPEMGTSPTPLRNLASTLNPRTTRTIPETQKPWRRCPSPRSRAPRTSRAIPPTQASRRRCPCPLWRSRLLQPGCTPRTSRRWFRARHRAFPLFPVSAGATRVRPMLTPPQPGLVSDEMLVILALMSYREATSATLTGQSLVTLADPGDRSFYLVQRPDH